MPASRRDLFRYLVADEAADYLAIMDAFTATLLADLSAAEVRELLATKAGLVLDHDTVEARCKQLERWGNLVPSIRDARVATVADYLRSRSRYQVAKLGGRVHRDAREILSASDGAREVARELLGRIVDALDRTITIVERQAREAGDVDQLAGEVTTIFESQRVFTESVRDFYAYLAGVLSRYDLGTDEYTHFKDLLLQYVDLITADVTRHAPAVAEGISRLSANRDALLALLGRFRGLDELSGQPVEHSKGRVPEDWDELAAWYGAGGASGPDQLRAAAGQALGQLLANAKRLLDTSGTGYSRRADLLRLARWFNDADDDTAHRIFAGSFLAYPARSLLLGPEEIDPRIGPTTSWWASDPVEVPVSLRERGDRTIRGRSSRVRDPSADRHRLHAAAERETAQRRAVVAELVGVRRLNGARISPAARDLLLELLADLLARHQDTAADSDLGLVLTARPGSSTVLHSDDGDLTVDALDLTVESIDADVRMAQ